MKILNSKYLIPLLSFLLIFLCLFVSLWATNQNMNVQKEAAVKKQGLSLKNNDTNIAPGDISLSNNFKKNLKSTSSTLSNRDWENISVPNSPQGRFASSMAYYPRLKSLILFGGWGSNRQYRDTWKFDGSNWQLIDTTYGGNETILQRHYHAMVLDEKKSQLVLFGGLVCSDADVRNCRDNNQTFVFKYNPEFGGIDVWWLLNPVISPPARYGHAMAYDSKNGKVVMFGGTAYRERNYFSDTWEFDGENWERINTVKYPVFQEHIL